jgi:hypothetical protein
MSEQHVERKRPRRRTILAGKIFDDSGEMVDCTIVDLSRAGALVRTSHTYQAEQFVNLKIDRFNELIRAEIMWSRDGHAGIRFVNEMIVVPKAMQKIFDIIGGAPRPR